MAIIQVDDKNPMDTIHNITICDSANLLFAFAYAFAIAVSASRTLPSGKHAVKTKIQSSHRQHKG
jgi:hypothetical protein